ncbi:hypothetical protein J6590_021472 [Homalodisca vitripennis]|nr:hypothetical protein J6590_021472 [Homalodisca vitripennis]
MRLSCSISTRHQHTCRPRGRAADAVLPCIIQHFTLPQQQRPTPPSPLSIPTTLISPPSLASPRDWKSHHHLHIPNLITHRLGERNSPLQPSECAAAVNRNLVLVGNSAGGTLNDPQRWAGGLPL